MIIIGAANQLLCQEVQSYTKQTLLLTLEVLSLGGHIHRRQMPCLIKLYTLKVFIYFILL